jgi:hypothetical protein
MKPHYELVPFGEVIRNGDVMWGGDPGETMNEAIEAGYKTNCVGLISHPLDQFRLLRQTRSSPAGATVAQDDDSRAVACAGGASERAKVDSWANLSPEQLESKVWALLGELGEARLAGSPTVVLEVLGDLTHAYRLLELQRIQRQQERVGGPQ